MLLGVSRPGFQITCGVDPDYTIWAKTHFSQLLSENGRFTYRIDKGGSLLFTTHGGTAPNRRNKRTYFKVQFAQLIGKATDTVVAHIEIDMRVEQSYIDAIKLHTVDFRRRCMFQHGIE